MRHSLYALETLRRRAESTKARMLFCSSPRHNLCGPHGLNPQVRAAHPPRENQIRYISSTRPTPVTTITPSERFMPIGARTLFAGLMSVCAVAILVCTSTTPARAESESRSHHRSSPGQPQHRLQFAQQQHGRPLPLCHRQCTGAFVRCSNEAPSQNSPIYERCMQIYVECGHKCNDALIRR
jgi:hypothetical protein